LSPQHADTIIQTMADSPENIDTIPLHTWLIEAGLAGAAVEEMFDGLCARLVAAGVPIARGFLSIGGSIPNDALGRSLGGTARLPISTISLMQRWRRRSGARAPFAT
jgi:hypothetical protein